MDNLIDFSPEEVRVMHQALNEVCNGIHFEDDEFLTRMGTDKISGRKIMDKLGVIYDSKSLDKSREKFLQALNKVPKVQPAEEDRLDS